MPAASRPDHDDGDGHDGDGHDDDGDDDDADDEEGPKALRPKILKIKCVWNHEKDAQISAHGTLINGSPSFV